MFSPGGASPQVRNFYRFSVLLDFYGRSKATDRVRHERQNIAHVEEYFLHSFVLNLFVCG